MANDRNRESIKKAVINNLKEALDPDKTYELTESTSFSSLEDPLLPGKNFSQTSWHKSPVCKNFYEMTAESTGYLVLEKDRKKVKTIGQAVDAFMAAKPMDA